MITERRFPGRQGRLLFAYLVAEQGRAVPHDELAEALWGDSPPATWDKALSVLVSKLRGLLTEHETGGAPALTGAFGCYRLELPEGSWVDVIAATSAAREAEDALVAGELQQAKDSAALAESLLRQPFLPGDDGAWVETKRRELAAIRGRALSILAEASLSSGDAQQSTRWAEQAIEVEPFRESGYRCLMRAHIAEGNRAEALRVYERCRRLLAQELGAFPSPETESIYRGLLEGSLARSEGESAPDVPPAKTERSAPPESPAPPTVRPRPGRRPRVRRAALVAATLVVAGAAAAAFALASRGSPPPDVLPNSVVRIDPQTLEVKQVVQIGDAPDLVVAAGGFVWIAHHVLRDVNSAAIRNAGDRTLTRVDPSTGEAVVVGGGLAPCGLTADPSGDVWVANCYPPNTGSRDNVVRVAATTLSFKKTWPVPGGDSFYRGLAYGGGFLWVGKASGGDFPNEDVVTQVDPRTGTRKAIRIPHAISAALAWSAGYGDLWINDFDGGSLTRLHPTTGAVETVEGVAINPDFPVVDGDVVWAGDWAAPRVERLRAVGPPRVRRITLPTRNRTAGVEGIAAGVGAIWATTPHDHALWRIDPKTNAVTRITVPYLPMGVTADANNVWVTVRSSVPVNSQ